MNANKDAGESKDTSRVFYINICQPLNPIPGVKCPPGAAVCMDPSEGPPIVSLFCNVSINNRILIQFMRILRQTFWLFKFASASELL